MPEERSFLTHKLDSRLNRLAYWLPLIPFTVQAGLYPVGQPSIDPPFIFIGNSRREVYSWQRDLAGLNIYLVVIDTSGQSLARALAAEQVSVDIIATATFPNIVNFRQALIPDKANLAPPLLFLPLAADQTDLLDEVEALTGVPGQWLSPYPRAAAEFLRSGELELNGQQRDAAGDNRQSYSAPGSDLYPLAFNLALFMSLFTLALSLIFGSEYSWFWFLLPWLACLGSIILPIQLPGLVRGLLWGVILSIPLVGLQITNANWPGVVSWMIATLLVCGWAGWRLALMTERNA